jgi:acyl-CoA synthetase (AMP-forming)/AMP-acid ligase II/acyl carrier protein
MMRRRVPFTGVSSGAISSALSNDASGRDPAWLLRSASSIVDILRWRAEHEADRVAYTFLEDGDHELESLTYATLDRQARALAIHLVDQGGTGERALLLHPPGLEFVVALLGCFYAGVVAVPFYSPKLGRRDPRSLDVLRDAGARFALTTGSILGGLDRALRHSPELGQLRWIAHDELPADVSPDQSAILWSVDPDSLAYLQYTSGSTRSPKGVMVSHRNLLANIDDIHGGFAHAEDSSVVSWLPHFHDMGLVYGLLVPLALGLPSHFMPPVSFLQRPFRWLQAMSQFGATHSGGPNFAYELCINRVTPEQKEVLDLTRWAVAFNGAEPVRKETLRKFAETFASCGFSPSALCPAYGLAEATLKVTTGRRGHGATCFFASASELGRDRVSEVADANVDGKALVGCGRPEQGTELLIVDFETRCRCSADEVGEIWVASPSVAKGYWNRPEDSGRVFHVSPSGEAGPGRFLRTGDLGFLRDGELFVTGRIKDLIIIRGRNHYPHDIELTVQSSHPALRVDGGAALSVEVDGEERLVVVQEVDRHHHSEAQEAAALIRNTIVEEHEIAPYAVALVRQNGVPKTSSGKIQRGACGRAFLDGSLPVVFEWRESAVAPADVADLFRARSREDIEAYLSQKVSSDLAISPHDVDVNRPFSSFGLDSLRAMTLLADIESWLGRRLSPTLFWNYPTISDLAAHLAEATPERAAVEEGTR